MYTSCQRRAAAVCAGWRAGHVCGFAYVNPYTWIYNMSQPFSVLKGKINIVYPAFALVRTKAGVACPLPL